MLKAESFKKVFVSLKIIVFIKLLKYIFLERQLIYKRKEWLRNSKITDEDKELLICSLHFNKDDSQQTRLSE